MACPFSNPRQLFSDLAMMQHRPGLEFSSKLDAHVVSRYDDIVSVLDQPDIFSSRPTVPEFPDRVKGLFANRVPDRGTLLGLDNPDHDRLRKSVASFFVPRRLQRFEPLLRQTAHELIDGLIEKGSVEIKANFALPLPLRTIVAVAGLDPARWQWIGRCLSLFGGITQVEEEHSLPQKVQDVLDLHTYVASVIEERRLDRRDDLISHIWNERDAGNVHMTDFEHLSMIPGLLLAGHETTTNVLSMGLAHLLHLDLWDEASADENTLTAAIEELLRYESAITGMRRVATKDTRIGETCLRAGDSLFVAYNAGSRDQTKFCRSNQVDLSRHSKTQHLGFGRGVHACLGAPFARLLLRTELSVLRERLPNLRLKTPYDEIEYGRVHEGRGPTRVEVAWDLPRDRSLLKRAPVPLASSRAPKRPIVDHEVVVDKIESFADSIKLLSLRSQDGKPLPTWSPGSHIDVQVGTLGYRQYSLCSNPADSSRLEIAVLREDKGAGGSQYIHENFKPGDKLLIRGPRNNFEFEAGGRRTVFIAGGIGITPIKPMVDGAAAAGLDYELIYLGKQRSGLAFVDEIVKTHGQRCTLWLSSEKSGQRLDLYNRYKNAELDGLRVYCCGPDSLLEGLEQALSHAPSGVLRLERFSNSTLPVRQEADNTVFDVVLARSGRTVHVPKDKTLLEVVNEAGAGVTSTCNKGLCGSCEVTVLEGTPEHLDVVLTASERAEGGSMMACVSRCRGSRLVLDLW